MFTWARFKSGGIAVYCEKEEIDEFSKMAQDNIGYEINRHYIPGRLETATFRYHGWANNESYGWYLRRENRDLGVREEVYFKDIFSNVNFDEEEFLSLIS